MRFTRSVLWLGLLGAAGPACFYNPTGNGPHDTSTGPTTGTSAGDVTSGIGPSTTLTGGPGDSTGIDTGAPTSDTGVVPGDTTGGTTVGTSVDTTGETGGTTSGETTAGASGDSSGVSSGDSTTVGTETSTGVPPVTCGDGVVDADEECDDGNVIDEDECTGACKLAVCGDGIVGPAEGCDDGNAVDDDACNNACAPVGCGDGVKQAPEECDASGESAICDANCTFAACGDGTQNTSAGEACDEAGPTATCDDDCTAPECGDGIHNASAGEACDEAGPTATCDVNCTLPLCGDGTVNIPAGEECDDGDTEPGDACSPTCTDTKIVQIALGIMHTCVRFAKGGVRCWGEGSSGQTGHGDTTTLGDMPGELPTVDLTLGGAATDLAAGGAFSCATVGGTVHCWGNASNGRLGYGNLIYLGNDPGEMPTPALDLGPGTPVQIDAYFTHSCAVFPNETVRCWGGGQYGKLGSNGEGDVGDEPGEMPPPPVFAIDQVKQVTTGGTHTCVLLLEGSVRCWGFNNYGQLGQGHTNSIGDDPGEIPPPATLLGGSAEQISAGFDHTCALMDSGNVRCWGYGNAGKLGTGNSASVGDQMNEVPKDVPLGGPVIHVGAGSSHTCALLASGVVKCWGFGLGNALGYGNTMSIENPANIPPKGIPLGDTAVLLAVGQAHNCALLADDTLRCWGLNLQGQLGYGTTQPVGDNETPANMGEVPF